jgi:hypothetical protein
MAIDLATLLDPEAVADIGVPASAQLLALTNAAHLDPARLPEARAAVEAAVGRDGLLEAAATIAVFNGLVRVADGTGIQLDAGVLADSADFRAAYGVDDFAGAANTTTTTPVAVDRSSVTDLFA